MALKPVLIPWSCLNDQDEPKIEPTKPTKTQKTFAEALNNVCDIPVSQLPKRTVKGDEYSISIPGEEYEAGLNVCKCNIAQNLGSGSSLTAELSGAMHANEIASSKNWRKLWLERDSTLVVLAFKSPYLVPWTLKNRWNNCIQITKSMNFLVSHIYREGNSCADSLANLGLHSTGFVWFDGFHSEDRGKYIRNMLGFPSYRFVNV